MAELSRRRLFGRRPTSAAADVGAPRPGGVVEGVRSGPPAVLSPQSGLVRPLESSGEEAPADSVGSSGLTLASGRSGPRGERTITVAVRLTPAEHARWVAAATAGGRGQVGRWVRETVTGRLDNRPVVAPVGLEVAEQVGALRLELSKVGSNLNQVARALNVQGRGGPVQVDRDTVLQTLEATRAELRRVRDQLNGESR